MYRHRLQVKELESRLLLNGSRLSPQPSPSSTAGTLVAQVAERSLSVGFGGGNAGPVEHASPSTGGVEVGPSRNVVPPRDEGQAFEVVEIFTIQIVVNVSTPASVADPTPGSVVAAVPAASASVAAPPNAPDLAAVAATGRTNADAVSLAALAAADGDRGGSAAAMESVPETPAQRSIPQPPVRLDNLVNPPGLRVGGQGLLAIRPVREQDVPLAAPDLSLPPAQPSGPRPTATRFAIALDEWQAEEDNVRLAPQGDVALAVLPPWDLAAVERGMQQFLEQIEQMGESLSRPPDGSVLYSWIMAGAAALVACELARRQLPRAAEESLKRVPRFPPGPPWAG